MPLVAASGDTVAALASLHFTVGWQSLSEQYPVVEDSIATITPTVKETIGTQATP